MKRIITFLIGILLAVTLTAQSTYPHPLYVGKVAVSTGKIFLYGYTSGRLELRPSATAGTGTVFQFPSSNGANGNVLTTNGSGVTTWTENTAAFDTSFIYAELGNLEDSIGAKMDTTNAVVISDDVQLLAQARSVMAFAVGSGDPADTTLLSTTRIYGAVDWGGAHAFVVDSMIVRMMHGVGLDTIGVEISYSDTLNAVVPVKLNTTNLAVGRVGGVNSALTVGQVDATFNNATIPSHKVVKMKLSAIIAGRKPTMVLVTLIGHLQ